MKLSAWLLHPLLVAACSQSSPSPWPLPTRVPKATPVATPETTPVVVSGREVSLGERIEGVFGDGVDIHPPDQYFFLTAPRTGTLTATLSWDPLLTGSLLKLVVDDRVGSPAPQGWSPVVLRVPVTVAARYRMAVGLAGADWLPKDPFVLTTSLEP
jgi:hypothetical protein